MMIAIRVVAFVIAFSAFGGTCSWAFTAASIKNTYAVSLGVTTAAENTTTQAYVGMMTFDGVSHVSASFTIVTGGVTSTEAYSGSYTVAANGSGALSMTGNHGGTLSLALMIASGGTALQFLENKPNGDFSVLSGIGTSRGAGPFSAASLKGSYAFLTSKMVTTSDPNSSEPDGTLGPITFDGAGHVTNISFTDDHKGGIRQTTGSGTYTVAASGIGTISVNLSTNKSTHFTVALFNGGSGFEAIFTNCACGNAAGLGTALRQ